MVGRSQGATARPRCTRRSRAERKAEEAASHHTIHLVEPALVDTPLARVEFARFGIDFDAGAVTTAASFAEDTLTSLWLG